MQITNKKYHTTLAEYFTSKPLYLDEKNNEQPNVRMLVEQPWQQTKAEMWDDFSETMINLLFIEANAKAGMIDRLLEEYSIAQKRQDRTGYISVFYDALLAEQHIIRNYPQYTFQQIYNRLWWRKEIILEKLSITKEKFIARGSFFLMLYKEPYITSSHLIMTLIGHKGNVTSCAFSPDGKVILSGSWDKTLKLWDAETGRELANLISGHDGLITCCMFSPNGDRIVSASMDQTLKIWDTITKKELNSFTGHRKAVQCCAFSPNGKQIMSGSGDNTIRIWDSETGRQLINPIYLNDRVLSCAFSQDGNSIAIGCEEFNIIKIFDVKTRKELDSLFGHSDSISSCAFSPNGKKILSGSHDNTLKLWSTETGKELLTFTTHKEEVECCTFSSDGKFILSGSWDKTLKLWDAETAQELATLSGHTLDVNCCMFSPDGKRIVSGSYDQTLKIWDTEINRELASYSGHNESVTSCAFSPDGKHVASVSTDKTLKIWDSRTGKELLCISGHKKGIKCCAYSPDGRRIATCSDDSTLKFWDADSGNELVTLLGHTKSVSSCTFSPNGKTLLSASDDHTLKIWDAETGKNLATISAHTGGLSEIISCAFSPDGKRLISVGGLSFSDKGLTLKLWEVDTWKELASYDSNSFGVFSPDGKYIISGRYAPNLKLWDSETGMELATFSDYEGNASNCAFSPNGKQFAWSRKNILNIWYLETWKPIDIFVCETKIKSFTFSPCGTRIVCGDGIGNLYFLKLEGFKDESVLVTPSRIWLFEKSLLQGKWQKEITYRCPVCGVIQSVDQIVLDNIKVIQKSNIDSNDSPYHKLQESHRTRQNLLSSCPKCGGKIKFNPFVIDNNGW